jgi:prefoldin beta subunit
MEGRMRGNMNMFKKGRFITSTEGEKKDMPGEEVSPQLQDQINRLQQARAQLQMITQQRQQVELQLKETEEAMKEIEGVSEKTPIYKSIGALLIKTKGKDEMAKELAAAKESLDVRKTTLEKQEGRSRERLTEMQSKVESALKLAEKKED